MVAGTNGKGTTCRVVETLFLAEEKSVGVYSSPHITDYRERVRINDGLLSQDAHCKAFEAIEQARGDIALTYFEFGTLAALYLLHEANLDIVILEVGLGGRLDAVNIVEPDISIITTIDLDHQDWLGDTRDKVAFEKAGILRAGKLAVIGELDAPATLQQQVQEKNCKAYWQNSEFSYQERASCWDYHFKSLRLSELPVSSIPTQNAATAITVVKLLLPELNEQSIRDVLADVSLPGRFQKISTKPTLILDVAHNPQATNLLLSRLKRQHYENLHLVVGMLADKDSQQSLLPFLTLGANWYLAPVQSARSASAEMLDSAVKEQRSKNLFESIDVALQSALASASENDLILVFGSFFTVAEATQYLRVNEI